MRREDPVPRVTTLVYAIQDGALALIERAKAPNLGLWSPPGGKVELGETPLDGALRELREETGLIAESAVLRAVVSEWDPVRAEAWLMFAFLAGPVRGQLHEGGREGRAAWVPLAEVASLPVPPADARILAAVRSAEPGVAFLAVAFRDGRWVDATEARG